MVTFIANGKPYRTDAETLALLVAYRDDGKAKMLALVFQAGRRAGRIVPEAKVRRTK